MGSSYLPPERVKMGCCCLLPDTVKLLVNSKKETNSRVKMGQGARSKFWGVSGSADRGGGDNSIQFINIGREGDKSFKEWQRKIGGWKGGRQKYFNFLCHWLNKKMPL